MWPWLWSGDLGDDWKRLSEYVRFVIERGVGPHTRWTGYPFVCLFAMTPPIVLAGAAVGLCAGWRTDARRQAAWTLVIVWLGLPLLRIAAPRSNFYDANRHFLEYVPALCCLAGIGLERAFAWARTAFRPRVATVVAVAVLAVGFVTPVAASHPYETAYFNGLVGGLGGAQRSQLLAPPSPHEPHAVGSEGDYWWSSLRNGLAYIRDHTAAQTIGVCGASTLHAQINWLGPAPMPRIVGSTDGYGIGVREIEATEYVYVMPRQYFCSADRIRDLEAQRPVVHRETRGGGLIFEILGPARSP
jgi:hypothetical protein